MNDDHMNEKISGPAYRVETPRLVVRCWQPTDAPLLKEAVDGSIGHLLPWLPWAHAEPEELQVKVDKLRMFRGKFDLGEDYVYAVFDRDEQRVIGGSGLHTRLGADVREIGYWIREEEINRGYATEVSAALTKVAFEIDGMNRVEIRCDPANLRSSAVPAKLGFEHEATLRDRIRLNDRLCDMMIWTLHASTYPGSHASAMPITAFDAMGREIVGRGS